MQQYPAFLVIAAVPLVAALMPAAVLAEAYTMEPVVVTATRTAVTARESLAPVTVITREDIERSQPQGMLELLRGEAGIDMTRSGGPGQNVSLFMRGTNSDHVLVLIDGVRVSSITTGGFAWQHLSPQQIERIEIVRGPRASLYGSDAIGGVIQIFTRDNDGAHASIGAGGDRTFQGTVGYGATTGRHGVSLNVAAINTDGFSATNEGIGFGFDPDDDGYRNRSLSARWNADLSDDLALTVAFWRSEGDIEFDIGTQDSINQSLTASLDTRVNERWGHSLEVGNARDELETDSAFASDIEGERLTASWQHDIVLGERHLLSAGLDYYREEGENVDRIAGVARFDEVITNRAAFAGLQSGLGLHDIQFSVRHDDHSRAGGETTGQVAWGHPLGRDLRVFASYGTAFKAPTLNQLFDPGFFGFFAGNPDLEPERSRSAEVGLRYEPADRPQRRVALNLFHTRIDDLIAFEGVNSRAINIDEASIEGLELEYRDRLGPWHLDANLTLQRPRNDDDDSRLLRRPDEKMQLTVGRDILGQGHLQAEVLLVGDREDFNTRLPGYGLVNVSGDYRLSHELHLRARIDNLLDKDYEMASGFNTQDRRLMVTLEYTAR
ncbi:MAG: TonB-dependent receptor [Gammaproteobacteria bacterium]|nr:TonB-dependent receptor [Gammaproteobacteria bacterium]